MRPRERSGGRGESGQGTVEAAVALPVLLLLVLLLAQPAILLYDRLVMESAAGEACRLLATATSDGERQCREFVMRRLGAVPSADCFHVHSSGCTWRIACQGDGSSAQTKVTIATEVRPLPLVGAGAALLGVLNEHGCWEVKVDASMDARADWADASLGGSAPADKVGAWLDDH